MIAPSKKISTKNALLHYRKLLMPRLIEERMLKLLRQNKISKWFSGIGQEAISVGSVLATEPKDYFLPMHRNLGVFTTRNVPLYPLFCQLLGRADSFTGGRDRSFHFGSAEHKIFGMISHLAATMPVADGIALAQKLKNTKQVAISFCGDGATSEGDFHEALNLAGVWKLPVIFIIENNGYGLSTPISEQYACSDLVDRAAGYGLKGMHIDGNNFFEVVDSIQKARVSAINGKPVLIEAKTFRMRGHEEASGTFYVPDEEFEKWRVLDPIHRYEEWMIRSGILSHTDEFDEIKKDIKAEFRPELTKALDAREPVFDEETELNRVKLKKFPAISRNGKGGSNQKNALLMQFI